MEKLIYFWKNLFTQPINTIYDHHIKNNDEMSTLGLIHFLIAAFILSINYGLISIQNNSYLSFVGTIFYFFVGSFWGISLLILYNLILIVILKNLFKFFKLAGQYYTILNIVLLSNFVFILNLSSIFFSVKINGLILSLFLIISILQSFFLEEIYEKTIYIKYISLFFISYISFSILSSFFFMIINLIM